MTIEKLDRYNDFVKWGLTDRHAGLSETTAEEEAFLKSIGAGEDEEEDDESDPNYWLDFMENAPD